MLKPLKAAPYGFLHYMEVLFMGGVFGHVHARA